MKTKGPSARIWVLEREMGGGIVKAVRIRGREGWGPKPFCGRDEDGRSVSKVKEKKVTRGKEVSSQREPRVSLGA